MARRLMPYRRRPWTERFWRYVNKDGPIVRESLGACWLWTGYVTKQGYGHIKKDHTAGGTMIAAHRASYELHVGPIHDGLFVCHACDNPPCVNPAHLWLGTTQDNTADKMAKGRHRYGPNQPSLMRAKENAA